MPFDQLFQFTHLCLDDPGIQSLKDDVVDAMELAKLMRDLVALDDKIAGAMTADQHDEFVTILAKAKVISDAFFTDVAYKFSPEELEALKPNIKNPIVAPPNRALRRQIGRLSGPDGRPL